MNEPQFPKPETVPAMPEHAAEAPEAGGEFEAPKMPDPIERDSPGARSAASSVAPASTKDPVTVRVESVMEEGLKDAYLSMTPALQQRFKVHGENVARQLTGMLKTLKVLPGKVLDLIRGWLKMIPGVNAFFLIQEAKIKTDKILALAEEERKKRGMI